MNQRRMLPNKLLCLECRHENFYRGAPPDACEKCGTRIEHELTGMGFTISRRPGEVFYLEDVDEHDDVVRIAIEVRSTSRNSVRLGIVAPDEVSVRRSEIPFAGQCAYCRGILRPGSPGPYCCVECAEDAETDEGMRLAEHAGG